MPYASREQISHLLKLTPRMVNKHVRESGMPVVARGQYDMVACVQWYVEFLRSEITRARRGDETEQQARARYVKASANLKELELDEEERRLVPVDAVKIQWERIIIAVKNKILVLPSKLPQKVITCKDLAEIKATIETEVYEVLGELSTAIISTEVEGATVSEPEKPYRGHNPTPRPAAKAKGERVGGQDEDTLQGVKRRARKVANRAG